MFVYTSEIQFSYSDVRHSIQLWMLLHLSKACKDQAIVYLAPNPGVGVGVGVQFELRPYFRGQRFLRSVWVNYFETL